MNGIESPILSYSDPIQFSQVPPLEYGGEGGGTEEALGKPLEWRAWQRLLPLPRLGRQSHNPP